MFGKYRLMAVMASMQCILMSHWVSSCNPVEHILLCLHACFAWAFTALEHCGGGVWVVCPSVVPVSLKLYWL